MWSFFSPTGRPPNPVQRSVSLRAPWSGFRGGFSILLTLLTAAIAISARGAGGVEHVVIIGCDGMGSLAFTPVNAPVMHHLMESGAYTLRARGVLPTSSSPNWASMIMGAGPEQHGVTSNDWQTNKFEIPPVATGSAGIFPTIFGTLRQQRPRATIVCIHDWDDFARLFEPAASDLTENVKGSPLTAARAITVIKEKKPTLTFIHFDDVDHAGHTFGWKSPQYYAAVEIIDGLIGNVLQSLKEAGMSDSTLVLVTADHGGKEKSHGGATLEEIEIPWILAGPGVAAGHEIKTPVNTYDTAPTVAYALGLKPPECWIGQPVREAFRH